MKQHVEIIICAKFDVIWVNSVGIINFSNFEILQWMYGLGRQRKKIKSLYGKMYIFDAL